MNGQSYSNSNLVSKIFEGSTRCDERDEVISKITIHHAAGKVDLDKLQSIMWDSTRKSSWNYGIDYSGNIGLYIKERYRAWTSNSRYNDMRSITIMVSGEDDSDPWSVSQSTYDALIRLCTDICQRNNIKALTYTGMMIGSNLVMHKWFESTECPGPYLVNKYPDIVAKVNANLSAGITFEDVGSAIVTAYSAAVTGTTNNFCAELGANAAFAANINPYIVTINRMSPTLDYFALRAKGVVGVMIEGGCLFASNHVEQSYRNPKLKDQCDAAMRAEMPRAIYHTVRARNELEAKKEINALMSLLYEFMPNLGVWLNLKFTAYSNVTTNNKILDLYAEKLEAIGFKGRIGLYVPRSQLNYIDWPTKCTTYSLWLEDHLAEDEEIPDLLTPQFFIT